jgi:predicted helicase
MSIHSVKQYQSEVEKIIDFGGSKNETAIRSAFYNLLNEYAKQKGLMIITEIPVKGSKGKNVIPDGTLKDSLRLDWGYWESKDEADDIDEEIDKKFVKGYPKENILFEDSNIAVLIQQGNEVMRISMSDAEALDRIIHEFLSYERPEVQNFHKAIELFKQDIPNVTSVLRGIVIAQEKSNVKFKEAENKFWELCKESINPEISIDDIREMMIQHILTEDIFNTIFGETQFHRENNIARELEQVILTFFTGNTKHLALNTIQHYYQAINAAAAQIADHHEKQMFLKVIYETFYKSYNPKAADRLGVVYTPNEIVKFMIESTDYLLYHHFSKGLEDKNVEILDPATGTGTFICDIIDYIKKDKLQYKYENEIHANEIAILPYYIANLNIEFTFKQKTGEYKEFQNLCFVDTLDNLGFSFAGKQGSLFGVSAENAQRIKRQNSKKISVIIGNPPYNANQMNENENNKNREYYVNYSKKIGGVDGRIKDTFIKYSTAQKTKVYDMYARFYRWAMDRIGNDGVVCFISNNSFINARTFDGFRKCVQDDFQLAYIIDLGGNIRELSGKDGIFLNEKHTIFGQAAAVGIAMMWLVKDSKNKTEKCQIKYIHPTDIRATRDEKLAYLQSHSFKEISFENVIPDKNSNWINLTDNDWEELIPLIDKNNENTIFKDFSNGINTARDQWVYDFDLKNLKNKVEYFKTVFNSAKEPDSNLKWSRDLKLKLKRNLKIEDKNVNFIIANYRPYVKIHFALNDILVDVISVNKSFFIKNNFSICFNVSGNDLRFIASNIYPDWHYIGDTKCVPLYCYEKSGKRLDNVTDWGLNQFREHYELDKKKKFDNDYVKKLFILNDSSFTITKEDIFHYVYAVLHNPEYRKKYELNLKRDFPRIPFYDDFHKWSAWGKKLMDLHINYETVKPYNLKIIQNGAIGKGRIESTRKAMQQISEIAKILNELEGNKIENIIENPKPKLKADKETGTIILDEATTLTGIPKEAWDYKLGNRSALEWILDQYKEKKPTDPTIAEKFNTYRFADYKTQVIDLLKRVCTVSMETMKIFEEMKGEKF